MELWLWYSVLAFFTLVAYFYVLRVLKKRGVDISVILFYIFLVFGISCFLYAIIYSSNLLVSLNLLFVIIIAAIFSYIGNHFNFRALEAAPNHGYSMAVTNSFIIIVTIFSVFLYGSEFNVLKLIGVIITFLGSTAVAYSRKKSSKKDSRWVLYSLVTTIFFASFILTSKYLLINQIPPEVYLAYVSVIIAPIFFFSAGIKKIRKYNQKSNLGLFLLAGLLSFVFNIAAHVGYDIAPNPGYVTAFNYSSIIVVALIGHIFFGDELSASKSIGIVSVIAGLVLMAL
jgi:drug/metabolite transporter (DMT)-like permease